MSIETINYKLTNFEGPLDFLLSLIRDNKLDIKEISLLKISDQFIDTVNKNHNLEQITEYIKIASILILMKSKTLLKDNIDSDISLKNDDGSNLIDRLIEYEKFKDLTKPLIEIQNNVFHFEKVSNDYERFLSKINKKITIIKEDFDLGEIIESISNFYDFDIKETLPTFSNNDISFLDVRKMIYDKLSSKTELRLLDIVSKDWIPYISLIIFVLLDFTFEGKIDLLEGDEEKWNLKIKMN